MQKYQNNETYRSYLSIYEKDKKLKLNKEKSKNNSLNKMNKIIHQKENNMLKNKLHSNEEAACNFAPSASRQSRR